MKNYLIALGTLLICGAAAAVEAQVATTYLPAPPVIAAPAPAPVIVSRPARVVTYYAAPPVVYAPRRYVVPAPVVVAPRTYVVRPKVYVVGQPLRNAIRAVTP